MNVKINGRKQRINSTPGSYVSILRNWQAGDRVEVFYGITLHEEQVKGDSSRYALMRGPIVMAGKLGEVSAPFSDPGKYNDYYTYDYQVPDSLSRMKFSPDIPLIPFYNAQRCRYVVYWNSEHVESPQKTLP